MNEENRCLIKDGVLIKFAGGGHVTVPHGVRRIEKEAFFFQTDITSISLPETLTEIGARAFVGCEGLTGIALPQGVTRLERGVFDKCSRLKDVTLPKTLTEIGAEAFSECMCGI